MEKSAAPVPLISPAAPAASANFTLELPVASDLPSVPAHASAELALEISAFYLPRVLGRPGFWKERAEERCVVEFDLEHPERVPATYPAARLRELFQG